MLYVKPLQISPLSKKQAVPSTNGNRPDHFLANQSTGKSKLREKAENERGGIWEREVGNQKRKETLL